MLAKQGSYQNSALCWVIPLNLDRNVGESLAWNDVFAGVAQLVERKLPKLEVAGSNPVARSISSSFKLSKKFQTLEIMLIKIMLIKIILALWLVAYGKAR